MRLTIFTHPNEKINELNQILKFIKDNSIVDVDISSDWKELRSINNIQGLKIYALSDPFETIENCMNVYDKELRGRKVRRDFIKEQMGHNLNDYSPLESSCLSYLLWCEIAKQSELDLIFKIEEPSVLFKYLVSKGILKDNLNYKYSIFPKYVPDIKKYKELSFGTLNLLGTYCTKYKYPNELKNLK